MSHVKLDNSNAIQLTYWPQSHAQAGHLSGRPRNYELQCLFQGLILQFRMTHHPRHVLHAEA